MSEGGKSKKSGKKGVDIFFIVGMILAFGLMFFGIAYVQAPNRANFESEEAYSEAKAEFDASGGTFRPGILAESFIDIPSIIITVGGTFASLMITYPTDIWSKVPSYFRIAAFPTKYDPEIYIDQITEFAKEARIKGLLSLEDKLDEAEDPFLKSSLMLVVDSVEPEKVHNLLEAEMDKMRDRHSVGRDFFGDGAAYAPGFGMIGTLIGLVNMLKDIDDPSSIGPAMATALLTTLYGSLLANVVFSPMAMKLKLRHEEEFLCKELIAEGVESIQAGENPKFIEEKLNMLIIQKDKKKKRKGSADDE